VSTLRQFLEAPGARLELELAQLANEKRIADLEAEVARLRAEAGNRRGYFVSADARRSRVW
jgi:uncharacterized small protein (DUF1192 family)